MLCRNDKIMDEHNRLRESINRCMMNCRCWTTLTALRYMDLLRATVRGRVYIGVIIVPLDLEKSTWSGVQYTSSPEVP